MARLMRCHTPHWQGNDMVKIGMVLPEGHPKVIGIFFEPFQADDMDGGAPPPQTQVAETKKRPGRPKLPRDAEGNIVREPAE